MLDTRLKVWKMKPTSLRRSSGELASVQVVDPPIGQPHLTGVQ